MISQKFRFRGRGSLAYLFRKGRVERVEQLSIKYVPSRSTDYRMAVVVSKKVSKSAVVRNRIRRRIYECVRTIKAQSNKPWPYDFAISVFDEKIAKIPHQELLAQIEKLLKKAKIV